MTEGFCENDRGSACCQDYHLVGGKCVECDFGYFGVNCTEKCVPGYYGRKCKKKCECDDMKERCDFKYGCKELTSCEGEICTSPNLTSNNSLSNNLDTQTGDKWSDLNVDVMLGIIAILTLGMALFLVVARLKTRTSQNCKFLKLFRSLSRLSQNAVFTMEPQNTDGQTCLEGIYDDIRISRMLPSNTGACSLRESTEELDCRYQKASFRRPMEILPGGTEYSRCETVTSTYNVLALRDGIQHTTTCDHSFIRTESDKSSLEIVQGACPAKGVVGCTSSNDAIDKLPDVENEQRIPKVSDRFYHNCNGLNTERSTLDTECSVVLSGEYVFFKHESD